MTISLSAYSCRLYSCRRNVTDSASVLCCAMSETVNRQDRELVIALEIAVLFCPHLEVKGVVLEEELCWNSLCSVGQV